MRRSALLGAWWRHARAFESLLRKVNLRQLRAHPGRAVLAVCAVALGVSLVLAVELINQAVFAAFRETIEGTAGRAQLQVVGTTEVGLPEQVLETVRSAPGVAVAVPIIEGVAFVDDGRGESVTVVGIDLGDEASVRHYEGVGADAGKVINDPLLFLARPDSVVVLRGFASTHELRLGDTIPVVATAGRQTLTVRGLLEPRGMARVYGTSLAVMDVFAAQRLFGKDGHFDRVDVVLAKDTTPEIAAEVLRSQLPLDIAVERPAQRGEQIEAMLRAFQGMLSSTSWVALAVAVFIIYNGLATLVMERRYEIGVLRALGVRRREIARLYLAEALCAGGIGAAIGCGLGVGAAYLLAGPLAGTTSTALGLPFILAVPRAAPGALAIAVGAGFAATVLGAVAPAVTAARVPPVEVLRRCTPPMPGSRGRNALLGAALLATLAVACAVGVVRTDQAILGLVSDMSLQAAFALLSIPAVLFAARWIKPVVARFFGVVGWLAGESSLRMPGRTAATVAALAMGLSMSTTVATTGRSFERCVGDWVRWWADRDLFVTSATKERGLMGSPLAGRLGAGLDTVSGVRGVARYRVVRLRYHDGPVALAGASLAGLHGRLAFVSDSFALRYRAEVGQRLRLETPRGPRWFRIAGVRRTYDSERGTVLIAYRTFRRLWRDRLVTYFGLDLAPGADPSAVRREILRRFGVAYRIQVLEPKALEADILAGVRRTFAFTWALEAVTLLVAGLGIFDTVLSGALARQREIGVLRTIGALRRQVVAVFALEGLLVGVLGAVLGITAGIVLSLLWVFVIFPHALGYLVDLHVPWIRLMLVALFAVALATASALGPARRAARVGLAEALSHE